MTQGHVKMPHTLSVITAIGFMASMTADAKVCLIHETVAQSRKNILGIIHKTNFTIVKVHNCPIYTQCCDTESTCCFDSSWFWSTVGIILFLVFLASTMSLYGRCKKRYRRGIANASGASACGTSHAARGPAHVRRCTRHVVAASPASPKPPAYISASSVAIPQPGTAGLPVVSDEAPPPYSALTGPGNYVSVCTQTTTV